MTIDLLTVYDLSIGLIATIGLVYLLVSQRGLAYRRSVVVLLVGMVLFLVVDPVAYVFAPSLTHLVHAVAALLVVFGLYDPIRNDLRYGQWATLVLDDPVAVRNRREWMTPMDDRILEFFHSTELVLTPAIIAYNLDHSRGEVNRRLSELERHGFLQRPERGKYRLTELGSQYLQGEYDSTPTTR